MASPKPWNRDKPFARLESPSKAPGRPRASGRGFERGAHSTKFGPTTFSDGPFDTLAGALMRSIPNWVSVEAQDRIEEIEGVCDRSFQTWTDYPPFQWHRWYDWNFHVIPDADYAFLRGRGNHDGAAPPRPGSPRPVSSGTDMECEWDAGSFSRKPGMMFERGGPIWPMSGQRVWLAGRWIYDCGHSTNDEVPEGDNQGLMRSELHPTKALAYAWWEAERFEENEGLFVPAIKFLFFASRLGGYFDFPRIDDGDANGNDYQFIVDLPEVEATDAHAIGHTTAFPRNTIVLRPMLLQKFDFDSFMGSLGRRPDVKPIIEELLPPDDPAKRQVKITIPRTELSGADAYGVIVSLGWRDVDGAQARRVKRCQVTLQKIHKGSIDHDTFAEEWLVKLAVNGRWSQFQFNGVRNNRDLPLGNARIEFFLRDDDAIVVSSHGAELDATHDAMAIGPLRVGGSVARWTPDIDSFVPARDGVVHSRNRADYVQARRVVDALTSMFMARFGVIGAIQVATDENDPLGLIDPGKGPAAERSLNPLRVGSAERIERDVVLTAFPVGADPQSAELTEQTGGRPDYTLHLHVVVEPQRVPGG